MVTLNNSSTFILNISNGSTPQTLSASKLMSSMFLLLTFIFGLVMNSLYLWVLGFRMRKSTNTTWFFHLILGNLVFTLYIPLIAVYDITKPRWILGLFMCKIMNSLISLDMYLVIFVLTMISVDRFCLVFHPLWYRKYMNPQKASAICLFLWILALLFTSPYLVFRKLKDESNITTCYNDYGLYGRWNKQQVKWIMFSTRLFLGFIIPFTIISICYLKIIYKIRKENLVKSKNPYKIISIAIVSFFVSWAPYHLWYGMSAAEEGLFPKSLLDTLQVLTICLICINSCFTPIMYLFIVENFKIMFRNSLMDLIELVLNETFSNRSLES
ncbi:hypothetical protein GDO81_028529 [Engystomops pustulosus]|uniref:Probable G-protein coupled receptor 33 n=1 Tax=Engystomops pustulosus TaxID=76066 RepID=A0AAV6YWG4_ENGPU|nr:hypothetical protein GDO81_028529 [Engystomops pustulosus]